MAGKGALDIVRQMLKGNVSPAPKELIHDRPSVIHPSKGLLRPSAEATERQLLEWASASPQNARVYEQISRAITRGGVPESQSLKGTMSRPYPDRKGEILDLSRSGDFPESYAMRYDSPLPLRGVPRDVLKGIEKTARRNMDWMQRGLGWDWYDMGPVIYHRDLDNPEAVRRLIDRAPAFSPQQSPYKEWKEGLRYHNALESGLDPELDIPWEGSLPNRLVLARRWDREGRMGGPKVGPYHQMTRYGEGNLTPSAPDTHMIQGWGWPRETDPGPPVKGVIRMATDELARRLGETPGHAMPPLWVEVATHNMMRAPKGLRKAHFPDSPDEPVPLKYYLRDQYQRSKAEVLDRVLADRARALGVDDPRDFARRALQGELGENFAGGGAVGGAFDALKEYVRKRLPRKFEGEELRHTQRRGLGEDDFWGSSRDVFQLGPDKLVKIAKRPRGLVEQSLEGDPRVQEFLPRLFWRSPDDELTVVERLPRTPGESQAFFEDMRDRFLELKEGRIGRHFDRHRQDPMLRSMMERSGMQKFFPIDVHGPDFFEGPEYHWSMRERPTLLDPGALDHRIAHPEFEARFAPQFREILDQRMRQIMPERFYAKPEELIGRALQARSMRPLEPLGIAKGTEEFIGPGAIWSSAPEVSPQELDVARRLLPPMRTHPPRLTGGMADGGSVLGERIKMLRQRLAGGGKPRNWLRGVKGSNIDRVLEILKEPFTYSPETLEAAKQLRTRSAASPLSTAQEQHLQQVERNVALGNWIDKNLANYIVREHGLENDPLKVQNLLPHPSAAKEIPAAHVPQVMSKEGPYSNIDMVEAMAGGDRGWVRERYPPWLVKLIEQDMPRMWSAKQYGAMVNDAAGAVNPAKNLSKLTTEEVATIEAAKKEYAQKYQRRHTPPINVYDLDQRNWTAYYHPAVRETLDYLRHAMSPEAQPPFKLRDANALGRMSVPDAIRQSKAWHEAMAKKKAEADAAKLAGLPVYKQYPTGERWIEMGGATETIPAKGGLPSFDSPAHQETAQSIGKALGHCYQHPDTCRHYLSQGKLYTLLDKSGKPRVTINSRVGEHHRSQAGYNRLPQEVKDAYEAHFKSTGKHSMDFGRDFQEWAEKNYPDIVKNPPVSLEQIRGPQNATPPEDTLPFVRDFIRGGKWSDVSELSNSGLERITAKSGHEFLMTPEEANPFALQWPHHPEGGGEPVRKGRYVRGDNYVEYDIPDDWKPQPFAHGGAVKRPMPRMMKPAIARGQHQSLDDILSGLRARLAGGGPVRNWIRGVKGSKFDKVIDELRERAGFTKDDAELLARLRRGNLTQKELEELELQQQIDDIPQTIKNMTRSEAIGNWVEKNLGNYMARQMGLPNDPLARAPQFMNQRGAGADEILRALVKEIAPASLPEHLVDEFRPAYRPRQSRRALREVEDFAARETRAAREALPGKFPPWLKKLYDQDTPRRLLEEQRAKKHGSSAASTKYKPESYVHDINEDEWNVYMRDPVHGVLDWMRHVTTPDERGVAEIRPENLFRVSVPQAFEGSRLWHEMLARKAEEAKNAPIDFDKAPWFKTHKQYPTGFRWVEYDPSYVGSSQHNLHLDDMREYDIDSRGNSVYNYKGRAAELEAALRAEGESMGHCVGQYCDQVLSGETRILSLRDPKGRPHVTVEVQPENPMVSGTKLSEQHPDIYNEWAKFSRAQSGRRRPGLMSLPQWIRQEHPELSSFIKSTQPSIVQIKGKGNRAPVDEYLPYVQDFVRSGKWGEVGDLHNTGLEKVESYGPRAMGDPRTHYMPSDEAARLRRYNWSAKGERHDPDELWLSEDDWIKTARSDPKWTGQFGHFSDDRLREQLRARKDGYRYDIPDDYVPPPIEFAAGGQVPTPADFPRETQDERLMRAQLALQILRAELAQPGLPPEERAAIGREIQRLELMIERLLGTGAKGESQIKPAAAGSPLEAPAAPAVLSGPAASVGAGGEEDIYEDAMGMLGRFIAGDPTSTNFLAQLMGDR